MSPGGPPYEAISLMLENRTMRREDWDNVYADTEEAWTAEPEGLLVAEVERLQPGHALDLGCGIGINAIWLAKQGWQVTGIDWAKAAIDKARTTADTEGVDAFFSVADISGWTPPQQFDLVISTFAMPPAGEQRKKAIRTAVASLAPGGTLLLLEWDRSSPGQRSWSPKDLVSVDELVSSLVELTIEKATTVHVDFEAHSRRDGHGADHSNHDRDDQGDWVAAFVLARRPLEPPKSTLPP